MLQLGQGESVFLPGGSVQERPDCMGLHLLFMLGEGGGAYRTQERRLSTPQMQQNPSGYFVCEKVIFCGIKLRELTYLTS